jgi:heat-inducible transcriptional repressor
VRERLATELARERREYETLEQTALALGQRVVDAAGGAAGFQVHIQGSERFLEAPEFADVRRMRELFAALEEKSKLLDVLDRTLSARELKIFIGADTEFSARTGASVVAAPYAHRVRRRRLGGHHRPDADELQPGHRAGGVHARVVSQLLDR